MLWLTWRQYRVALLIGALLLVLYGLLFLAELFASVHSLFDLSFFMPQVVAVFVGAPFVAQEREQKTHYVVWGQGTSRGRWFLSRLAWVTLGTIAIAGLFCWSANAMTGWLEVTYNYTSYWGRPGIVLGGLTLFGLMLGVMVGSFTRKSIVAMALTFVLLLICYVVYSQVEHRLIPPHIQYTEYQGDKALWGTNDQFGIYAGFADRQGDETGDIDSYCRAHDPAFTTNVNQCVKDLDLQWKRVYLTPDQFWPTQFAGTALLLIVSFVLALVAFLRIRSAVD
ncbi:ABC transporter permease [Ktedonospora formicarum]|uniref:Transporter n=1 Tax=Ktedonospora formicarum TaxID=2778364 RepID=A0A8J3MTY2_9CHLR|nr:ABC transporter permease subunit [Ktedonospora formicarum]GHO46391.1 transporter [Ktedonospora formicarum]